MVLKKLVLAGLPHEQKQKKQKKHTSRQKKKRPYVHEDPVLPHLSSLYVLTSGVCFQGLGTFCFEFVCSLEVLLIVQRRTHQGDGKVLQVALR